MKKIVVFFIMIFIFSCSWFLVYSESEVEQGLSDEEWIKDFYPYKIVTREEFMFFVNKAFHLTDANINVNNYTDIKDSLYLEDIKIALKAGYIKGTSPTTVSPTAQLTREQAMVILTRLFDNKKDSDSYKLSKDFENISIWARDGVSKCIDEGFIIGDTMGNIMPQSKLTVDQIRIILERKQRNHRLFVFPKHYDMKDKKSSKITILGKNITLKNVKADKLEVKVNDGKRDVKLYDCDLEYLDFASEKNLLLIGNVERAVNSISGLNLHLNGKIKDFNYLGSEKICGQGSINNQVFRKTLLTNGAITASNLLDVREVYYAAPSVAVESDSEENEDASSGEEEEDASGNEEEGDYTQISVIENPETYTFQHKQTKEFFQKWFLHSGKLKDRKRYYLSDVQDENEAQAILDEIAYILQNDEYPNTLYCSFNREKVSVKVSNTQADTGDPLNYNEEEHQLEFTELVQKFAENYILEHLEYVDNLENPQFYRNLENQLKTIANTITNDSMTDFEKELAIFDYIGTNYAYADDLLEMHDVSYMLESKKGTCDAYATLFKYLAKYSGLEVKLVYGSLKNNSNAHVWNLIHLDGEWYYVDTTPSKNHSELHEFSDGTKYVTYGNLNMSSMNISDLGYLMNPKAYPTLTAMDYNYYIKNDLIFNSRVELEHFVKNRMGLLHGIVRLKMPYINALNYREEKDYLSQLLTNYNIAVKEIQVLIKERKMMVQMN